MDNCVEFKNISKSFPGVKALDNVSFRAERDSVCALMGENGAGKSTLLKILSGDLRPDEGSLLINGEEARFHSPHDALKASISVIYQERQLVPTLSIMENVFIDDYPRGRFGLVDWDALRSGTQALIDRFGLPLQPTEIVNKLSVAHQQMVEIMKALRRDSAIIAFDEPTSCLTDTEVNILFELIDQLKKSGKVILYVSHRIAEIFRISDKVVVLKDGRLVADNPVPEIKTDEDLEAARKNMITAMVGRDIGDTYANLRRNENIGDVIFEVENLSNDDVRDISFSLRKGEILGFAGLIGAGRTEVVRAVFGADRIETGTIRLEGREVRFNTPKNAIASGVALCPEDRKEQGLVLGRSILNNISIPVLHKVCAWMFLHRKKEASLADAAVERFTIRTPSVDKVVMELSGGNQQKVILGRWTSDLMETKILILDEPTKGIDVGSKAEIYQMMCDLAGAGISVIFISSELTEVVNISDRIVVMQNGRITGIVNRQEATEESVLALAIQD